MRKKLLIVLLAGVAVIIIVIVGIQARSSQTSMATSGSAENVSTSFIDKAVSGDAAASYALFSSDTKQELSLLDWATTVGGLSARFNGQQPTLATTTNGTTNHLYRYQIHGSDGAYTVSILVVPQDKGWAVQTFNSVLDD